MALTNRERLAERPIGSAGGIWAIARRAGATGDFARHPQLKQKATAIDFICTELDQQKVTAALDETAHLVGIAGKKKPRAESLTTETNAPTINPEPAKVDLFKQPKAEPAPTPAPVAPRPANAPDVTAAAAALAAALAAAQGSTPVDVETVRKIAAETFTANAQALCALVGEAIAHVQNVNAPVRVEIKTSTDETPRPLDGVHHKAFPDLLKACAARVHCWLYGPPGTGKTTAAKNAAAALGLAFYGIGAVDSKHEIIGYTDATGKAVLTAFRRAFTSGGVFIFDEADASHPAALLAINNALANGWYTFPGDEHATEQHADFVCIIGANTKGLGADANHNARQRQDAATTDRFAYLEWAHDDALEEALAADAGWLRRIRSAREWIAKQNIRGALVSTRATIRGAQLIAAGWTVERADLATWAKFLTPEQYKDAARTVTAYTQPLKVAA